MTFELKRMDVRTAEVMSECKMSLQIALKGFLDRYKAFSPAERKYFTKMMLAQPARFRVSQEKEKAFFKDQKPHRSYSDRDQLIEMLNQIKELI